MKRERIDESVRNYQMIHNLENTRPCFSLVCKRNQEGALSS